MPSSESSEEKEKAVGLGRSSWRRKISRNSLLHLTAYSLWRRCCLASIGDSTAGLRFGDVTIHLFSRIVGALCFVQTKPRLMLPEEFYRLGRDHHHEPFGKSTSTGGHDEVFSHARAAFIKVATPYF
jgi:hypothetical protein